jgi:threonine dehydratase
MQIADPTKLDAIFVAIGGGGLIAGIAAYVKALHPHIKVCACLQQWMLTDH